MSEYFLFGPFLLTKRKQAKNNLVIAINLTVASIIWIKHEQVVKVVDAV